MTYTITKGQSGWADNHNSFVNDNAISAWDRKSIVLLNGAVATDSDLQYRTFKKNGTTGIQIAGWVGIAIKDGASVEAFSYPKGAATPNLVIGHFCPDGTGKAHIRLDIDANGGVTLVNHSGVDVSAQDGVFIDALIMS